MTKRYWVQQDEGAHAGEWQVLNRRTDLDRMWVASFDKKEHADRFAAELNREEGARQRAANDGALLSASLQASMQINQAMQRQYEQMLSEQVMPAVVKHFSAFTQHKDAIPPPADTSNKRLVTVNGQWRIVRDEKPQHPNEGPVCCRKHAPIQWAFNSEVWGKLKERCER